MTNTVSFRSVVAIAALVAGTAVGMASQANAAGTGPTPPAQSWSTDGMFGTFDRAALRRGLQVYREVCSSCHSMNLVAYRHLGQIGFSEGEIKAIASEYEVEDGPNDEGDMFTRAAIPADPFVAPFANDNAARASNGGALPPDFSLIVKARPHGTDYIYALLTGYVDAPDDFALSDGMNYNEYFPGHQIAMAQPLWEEGVEFGDGTPATVEQMAHDVTEFLHWAAEPDLEDRKRVGLGVIIFLIVFTGLAYQWKRRVWSDLH